jgi:hypothetical protein
MCRVRQVGTVQRIRVRKHGHGLVERDPMFSEVGNRLARVPREHNSVYTQRLHLRDLSAAWLATFLVTVTKNSWRTYTLRYFGVAVRRRRVLTRLSSAQLAAVP